MAPVAPPPTEESAALDGLRRNWPILVGIIGLIGTGYLMMYRLGVVEEKLERFGDQLHEIHVDVEILKRDVQAVRSK